uniref:Small ribosomal subunit protein eS31 domain-containing protein n=1 Tax=Timema genevievae TaxID=629358 RepID=A0A7R9K4Y9_TIMGE|nr:unnamed protein product [Timema genevievae]
MVDENGKIHRLRRECPSEQCGAGVFMAAMEDRHYCGKCGYTLVFSKPEEKEDWCLVWEVPAAHNWPIFITFVDQSDDDELFTGYFQQDEVTSHT